MSSSELENKENESKLIKPSTEVPEDLLAENVHDRTEIEELKTPDDIQEISELLPKKPAKTTAVILFGGKQYVISEDEEIVLPMPNDQTRRSIKTSKILMAKKDSSIIGEPFIEGAYARLIPVDFVLKTREINFKRRRRKNSSKRTRGLRKYSQRWLVKKVSIPSFENEINLVENSLK